MVPERVDCETDDVLEFPLEDLLGDSAGQDAQSRFLNPPGPYVCEG